MGNETQTQVRTQLPQVPANGGAEIVRQDFGATSMERRRETAQTAAASQQEAQVRARYVMAMQRPRNWDNVRALLLKDCERPNFAKRAYFSVPRGNKPGRLTGTLGRIEGLSVRFVEDAFRIMGNVWQDTRTIYDDDQIRTLSVTSTDLETNAGYGRDITISKVIERRKVLDGQIVLSERKNTSGQTVFLIQASEDEMLQREGAIVSKTFRTEGIRLIPADIIDECEQKIIATVTNEDAKDPDEARKSIADGFTKINVLPSELTRYLGHDMGSCSPAELRDLRGLYAAIRDGETTWHEIMEARFGEQAPDPQQQDPQQQQQQQPDEKKRSRGSQLASRVRERGGAPAPAQAEASSAQQPQAATPPAATPTAQPTPTPAAQADQPVTKDLVPPITPAPEPDPAPPEGRPRARVEQQSLQVAPTPAAQQPAASPPIARALTEQERKTRMEEEMKRLREWPDGIGLPVLVETAGGQVETWTTSTARMFGEMAVVNVNGIPTAVPLSKVTIVKKSDDPGGSV